MTPKLEALLFEKHKQILRGKNLSVKENLMPFGFECGDGWFTLIDELCSVIDWILECHEEIKGFIVLQVKEKFGTLRVYVSTEPDAIHGAIMLAEAMSSKICEQCGNPGKTAGKGWIRTECDTCRDVREKSSSS